MPLKTSTAYALIEKLWLKNRNFCSEDYDACLDYFLKILPFEIHSYSEPHNSWEIPPKWDLVRADIFFKGELIYQVDHPLKIIGLSKPFKGKLSKEALQEHLHFDHRYSDAIPYHFRQFYRPWEREWGFCVSKDFYDALEEGEYEVHIETRESPGTLKVAEYTIDGESPECFTFVAHLDHPGMANDDLAGVAMGVELFERLSKKKTKFSYKLILLPEIIGSEFYLGKTVQNKELFLGACFLEMLGSKTPLALQFSLNENSKIETKLQEILKERPKSYNEGPFKSIICNDEAVWQSHGIPMCSLSRFPYPEYHSSRDSLSIIDQNSLDEAIEVVYQAIASLETLTLIEKKFEGTPCTSHPDLNLYVDPGQRAFGSHATSSVLKLRLLMDLLPAQKRFFYLEDLASEVGLSKEAVLNYLKQWEAKGLLKVR